MGKKRITYRLTVRPYEPEIDTQLNDRTSRRDKQVCIISRSDSHGREIVADYVCDGRNLRQKTYDEIRKSFYSDGTFSLNDGHLPTDSHKKLIVIIRAHNRNVNSARRQGRQQKKAMIRKYDAQFKKLMARVDRGEWPDSQL